MNWWQLTPKELMSRVYWQREQLPPTEPEAWQRNLAKVIDQLRVKQPPPQDWNGSVWRDT